MKTAETRPATPDEGAFRRACGQFATGVAVVATQGPDGRPAGLTVNSFTSVSLDPPLVLFCLDDRAGCLAAFAGAPGFAVNVLAEGQADLSRRFAGAEADKFAGLAWRDGPRGPVLAGVLASFQCRTDAVHRGGDHLILVGAVEAVAADPSPAARPLVYWRGDYRAIGR